MINTAETIEAAVQYHRAGQFEQAEALYRLALQNGPNHPDALHALGVLLSQRGKNQQAFEVISKAIEVNPKIAQYHNTLGVVLEALDKPKQAVNAYQQAVQLAPDYAEAYLNMAIALKSLEFHDAAIEKCKKALSIKPDYAQAYNTLGYCLDVQGKDDGAIENYSKAIKLAPNFAEAYNHLGTIHSAHGRYDEAIENYRRAIQIDPYYAEVHWNLAPSLLVTGRLADGWKEYRWRRHPELEMLTYPHHYEQPCWDGSHFVGKRLLVHYEQGLGDTINFLRYIPMVKSLGGTVILEVGKSLYNLLRGFAGIDELIEASFNSKPTVDFDFHISLMDLPGIFGTTLETIPAEVPYISAEPDKVEYWRNVIRGPEYKVGIVWSGSPLYERNHRRACKLRDFAALSEIEGVKYYALQKGKAAEQIKQLPEKISVVNLGEQFDDFSDTAAAIENLDLIISTDTSVPHLAGAMGKPTWLLLSCVSDWRWLLDRDDSPWYPTIRLFRQTEADRWDDVFGRVAEALQTVISGQKIAAFS